MKYVIGYKHGDKFIVLYSTYNIRLAFLMRQKLKAQSTETIEMKKVNIRKETNNNDGA